MFPSSLEVEKTGFQLFRSLKTQSQLFKERKKWIPAIWRLKNVVQNCQDQGKRFLHLFKVKKIGSLQLGARIKCFPAILIGKNWFVAISSLTKLLQLFGESKMWIPAIWRLNNVVHNCQEQRKRFLPLFKSRKTGSQHLRGRKKCFLTIWNWRKLFPSYFEPDKHCWRAIWREKNVDPCYLETKKCSSQQLGARKKIMTSI